MTICGVLLLMCGCMSGGVMAWSWCVVSLPYDLGIIDNRMIHAIIYVY